MREQDTKTMKGDQEREDFWGGGCIDGQMKTKQSISKPILNHSLNTHKWYYDGSIFFSGSRFYSFIPSEVKGWLKSWLNHKAIDCHLKKIYGLLKRAL